QYGDGPTVLPDLDLHIPAGQTIALVGTTGAGKSTVAKLVTRFYDATDGHVRLDGIDVRDLTSTDLRRAVVMVTQEAYLFSGSVRENIALGRPDASMAEIEQAARAVGAHEFIEQMPDGYDTDVNKRGGRVSSGQRQLLSFARAFLADPAVLVLDEATSSLDIPGERQVQHGLQTLLADRTAIIIAHRLSTVAIADRVLVMAHGQIVEDGTPADLIARSEEHTSGLQSRENLVCRPPCACPFPCTTLFRSGPGRGHQLARHSRRAPGAARAADAARRPDGDHHRAPALDGGHRGPRAGDGARPDRRGRHSRRPHRRRRALRRAARRLAGLAGLGRAGSPCRSRNAPPRPDGTRQDG